MMPKNKGKALFDDEESEEENVSFNNTHNEYAKRYDSWRQKEELHKLEQKYGEKGLNSDGSVESDSEDEEPEEMTPEQEEQFLKTLALLKTKDPRIYDPKYTFFEEGDEETGKVEEKVEEKSAPKKEVNSLAAAFADSDDDDDNGGEIFKVEKKTPLPPNKTTKKDEKLKAYLKGAVDAVEDPVAKDLEPLRALWSDPKLDDGEKFLRDYILNDKHLEDSPLVADAGDKLMDSAALEADEELVEEQGRFERAYNFRFEEPDHEYLKRYPRTLNSIRPKDDSRSRKRVEVRTRKEEEKTRRMEEIGRMKALKLKEIREKIARIKEVTGNDDLGFQDEDIEGDFDPQEHDRRMKAIFDEQYYGDADDEKPVFPDLDEELEIENWEKYEPELATGDAAADDSGPHCEDEDFNMDCDYDQRKSRATLEQEIQETLGKKRRNRKKKSKLAEVLSTTADKPKFVPELTDKSYSAYMEEYYKLDCEDIIAGEIPTRFKYRDVVPNDFGLTVEEILLADDKELNSWASLKKTVKYRPEHIERSEVGTYRERAADQRLKRRVLPSLFKDVPEEPEVVVPVVTKKKNNKSKNKPNTVQPSEGAEGTQPNAAVKSDENQLTEETTTAVAVSKKEKKKLRKKPSIEPDVSQDNSVMDIDKDEASNEEEDKTNTTNNTLNDRPNTSQLSTVAETKKKRRKKKKKPKQNSVNIEQNGGPSPNKKQNGDVKDKNTENAKKNYQAPTNNKNNLKRKLDTSGTEDNKSPAKKKKKNNKKNKVNANQNGVSKKDVKNKFKLKNNKKAKDAGSENPLSKLSNERLKAYGLNPKKYRSFLKYKKF